MIRYGIINSAGILRKKIIKLLNCKFIKFSKDETKKEDENE
jgi:hypothetical protein